MFLLLVLGSFLGIAPFVVRLIIGVLLFFFVFILIIIKKFDYVFISLLIMLALIYSTFSINRLTKEPFIRRYGIVVGNKLISLTGTPVSIRGKDLEDGIFVRVTGKQYNYKNTWYIRPIKIDTLNALFVPVYKVRNSTIRRIKTLLPGVTGDIGIALFIGDRRELPDFVKERFRTCGASHLLAVSGLHTGIIFLILSMVLSLFPIRRHYVPVIASILLFPYIFLTGFRISVLRAFLMLLIYSIGVSMQKRTSPLNAVGAAGIILILLNPLSVISVSFQLSFLAVTGILLFFEFMKRYLKNTPVVLRNYVFYPAVITTSAQLFTLPVVYFYFGYIPLYSVFANLILIPLVTGFLAGIILLLFFPFLNSIIAPGVWVIGMAFNKIMMAFQHLPGVVITGRPNVWIFLVYPALMVLYAYLRFRNSP